ncbi:microtubule associated protein-domain-containing protein [Fomitopsis serialis]|uniref:microtubule associated protein-domain-containing protein n=1 Tax=Fomitopsis serialis TaxID=139415 RepID=UPI00200774DD|nr:microtubule associated protein-domain-containing protein [Neoantrodia serialis]KAH9925793.1 microtubule associated protein-domain-containing protein [Neoantrodia serialis]
MSTTITSLLNTLHTHLQSQTQLLPTLHAQLGLPPTALTGELATLQQQLTECIDGQIDLRRKQVDEWMERCIEVENQCIRYGNALGGHVKATGGSVGEIRKEQVLPRRFEIISEYQEKLRQLYHTKLEQLLTLTGRLGALASTLGPDFYAQDIFEPTPASGEDEYDSSSHRDVTPERFSRLEKELVRGKGEVTKRLALLSATMVQIDWLYTELGMSPPALDDLPSSSSLTVPPSHVRHPFLSTSMSMSIQMSTPTPATRTKQCAPLCWPQCRMSLEKCPSRSTNASSPASSPAWKRPRKKPCRIPHGPCRTGGRRPDTGPNGWAESKHIQAMYDQLEALWRRLGVPDADIDGFVEAQRGSTDATLERMLELKRERMGTFVENARAEIIKLWDELMVSEEERADFAPFADDEHTEELLAIHEEEIRRLKEERRLKGPLLASIRKYFDICEDEKELAAAASDQSRLLGRGPRDPGRLLREEKMRKRVNKEKPRLEQDLLASIPAWEAETGRAFLVHGESMVQLLMETVGANDKENNKRSKTPGARAGSVPPRSKTPSNPHITTCLRRRTSSGVVTPAVRPGSSMAASSQPSKRPRLGESTAAHTNVPAHGAPAYLGSSKGPGAQRPGSPSKIPGRTPSTAIPTSSLPRPVPLAMPVPKPGTVHHALGHGRVPSAQAQSSYHPYQSSHNQTRSTSSTSSTAYRSYGAPALSSNVLAKKASRARRESFRPRPSMENDWAVGGGRWAGFAGAVVKEEEDY